jgi:hypothetical protein
MVDGLEQLRTEPSFSIQLLQMNIEGAVGLGRTDYRHRCNGGRRHTSDLADLACQASRFGIWVTSNSNVIAETDQGVVLHLGARHAA